jgi:hypothetical protein
MKVVAFTVRASQEQAHAMPYYKDRMNKKPKPDFTQIAFRVGQQAAHLEPSPEEPEPLSPKAAAGRKGGLKGGSARAAELTAEERSEAARRAARARWGKKDGG